MLHILPLCLSPHFLSVSVVSTVEMQKKKKRKNQKQKREKEKDVSCFTHAAFGTFLHENK